jgi:hypothetical protein
MTERLRQWLALVFDKRSRSFVVVASRNTLVALQEYMDRSRKSKDFVIAQKRMTYSRF